jgi:hypothetical protein
MSGVVSAGLGLANAVKAGPSKPADTSVPPKIVNDAVSSVDTPQMDEAGVKTFADAINILGASPEDALEAANAVTGVVTNKIPDQTPNTAVSIPFTPDTEFGDLQGAMDANTADDVSRTERTRLAEDYAKSLNKSIGKLTKEEAKLWSTACDTLFIAANPVPVKNLMHAQGKIKTNVLRAPLHHADLSDNSLVLKANTDVANWYKENHD